MGKDQDVDAVLTNAPAYSGRPSFVSQSVISCIAAQARLNSALWTRWMGDFSR